MTAQVHESTSSVPSCISSLFMTGYDEDGDLLDFIVTRLPSHGVLELVHTGSSYFDEAASTQDDGYMAATVPFLVMDDGDVEDSSAIITEVPFHCKQVFPRYQLRWWPAEDSNEPANIGYRAWDGQAYSTEATIDLHINPVDGVPITAVTSHTVDEDGELVNISLQATDADSQFISLFITKLPAHGLLYKTAPGMTGRGDEIVQPYSEWEVVPPIEQHASNVRAVSTFWAASATIPRGNNQDYPVWHPFQILGEPDWKGTNEEDESSYSPSTRYGDTDELQSGGDEFITFSHNTWASYIDQGFTEFIEVEIETPVYLQSVEIGENCGTHSIVKVKAWDSSTGLWQTLHSGKADSDLSADFKEMGQVRKFVPSPFCQTTFKASIIRIEMDTYETDDWNELNYVKILGATELKQGVLKADVATQAARVVYVPDADFTGVDSLTFRGCDCAYDSARASDATMVTLSVLPVNDRPVAQSSAVAAACAPGVFDEITLQASDVDAITEANAAIAFTIASLPLNAALYDAISGALITPASLPAAVSGATIFLLADFDELADAPSGFEFTFTATDEAGAVSAEASSIVTCSATECPAGEYFDMTDRVCTECPAGTFVSDAGIRSSCDDCPVGTFAPLKGQQSCGPCANGQVTLTNRSTDCTDCPLGARCSDTSSLALKRGMWRPKGKTYSIYECPIPEACLGGSGYDSALCAVGYVGALCGVCQRGFVQTAGRCVDCASLRAPIAFIALLVAIAVIFLTVWYLTRTNNRFVAAMESIALSVPLKIYFCTCQILGTFATLLSDVLFQPLKGFLVKLASITNLADLVGGFGVSCAHHELRSFKARILGLTLVPAVLSICIAALCMFRVLWSHPNRIRALRRAHATFILLLLYVTLPSTSSIVFKTFVRDSRPLGKNGEQYLIADYAGKS